MADEHWQYRVGHVLDVLKTLPDESVQMVVTSPPYWGLRSYIGAQTVVWGGDAKCEHEWGDERISTKDRQHLKELGETLGCGGGNKHSTEGAIIPSGAFCQKCSAWRGAFGLEPTIELYVEHTTMILREIRRVLRSDGCVFWNIGDSYAGSNMGHGTDNPSDKQKSNRGTVEFMGKDGIKPNRLVDGLKPKDLCMIPFRVALAAQSDGWWVRSDIIWAKPNPMPESCTDRPTKSHEYIFLFTKSKDYYWDADAVREPHTQAIKDGVTPQAKWRSDKHDGVKNELSDNPTYKGGVRNRNPGYYGNVGGRNIRSVWNIATQPYSEAHFATFPEAIPITCIKAGSSEKGCCPKCHAPWERVIEKGEPDEEHKVACGADSKGEYHGVSQKFLKQDALGKQTYTGFNARWKAQQQNASDVKARILAGMVKKTTTSWKPTCECGDVGEPIPCVVLDPFAGSGTTLKVARDLGRWAIGIDISEPYKKLAKKRAALDQADVTEFIA